MPSMPKILTEKDLHVSVITIQRAYDDLVKRWFYCDDSSKRNLCFKSKSGFYKRRESKKNRKAFNRSSSYGKRKRNRTGTAEANT